MSNRKLETTCDTIQSGVNKSKGVKVLIINNCLDTRMQIRLSTLQRIVFDMCKNAEYDGENRIVGKFDDFGKDLIYNIDINFSKKCSLEIRDIRVEQIIKSEEKLNYILEVIKKSNPDYVYISLTNYGMGSDYSDFLSIPIAQQIKEEKKVFLYDWLVNATTDVEKATGIECIGVIESSILIKKALENLGVYDKVKKYLDKPTTKEEPGYQKKKSI